MPREYEPTRAGSTAECGGIVTRVVVPCYNEARRLRPESLFVDDGSSDETPELLAALVERRERQIELLYLKENGGKGEAVRRGLLLALERGSHYVGYWDADLAAPLSALPELIALLDGRPELEAVLGSRVPMLGREVRRSRLRRLPGRLFARLASLLLGVRAYDTQCGAKLLRATPALRSLLTHSFATRWCFDVELLARLIRASDSGASAIWEHPLPAWREVGGSSLGPREVGRVLGELFTIRRQLRR
jgi:glycosyltransferase involved in cell wall biosynthesis